MRAMREAQRPTRTRTVHQYHDMSLRVIVSCDVRGCTNEGAVGFKRGMHQPKFQAGDHAVAVHDVGSLPEGWEWRYSFPGKQGGFRCKEHRDHE